MVISFVLIIWKEKKERTNQETNRQNRKTTKSSGLKKAEYFFFFISRLRKISHPKVPFMKARIGDTAIFLM